MPEYPAGGGGGGGGSDSGAVATETARARAAEALISGGRYYLDAYSGTDDQKFAAALAALLAASPAGGTIVLGPRAHTFANQWATPYTGVAIPIRVEGAGVAYNGNWTAPAAATTATFTYSGSGAAMMDFQHIGTAELVGIQFKQANTGKPFCLFTNATPKIRHCAFSGGGNGGSCVTDVVLLGGTGITVGAGDSAPFQGYGGIIEENFFDGVRKHVVFGSFANGVQVLNNTGSATCGSTDAHGAPYEFAPGASAGIVTGNRIAGNTIELVHYKAAVKCVLNAEINTFGPNGLFDATAGFSEYHYFAPGAGNDCNLVIDGYSSETYPLVNDADGTNTYLTPQQSVASFFAQGIKVSGATSQFTGSAAPAMTDGSNAWQDSMSGAFRNFNYTPSGGALNTVMSLAVFGASFYAWLTNAATFWIANGAGPVSVLAATGDAVNLGDSSSPAAVSVQKGSLIASNGGAGLAAAATDGFVYLPVVAGPPTGIPTAHAGGVAACYDSVNHKVCVYDGGWKGTVVA